MFLPSDGDDDNEGFAARGPQEVAGYDGEGRVDAEPGEGELQSGSEQAYTPPTRPDQHKVQVFPADYHRDAKFYTWYMVGHEIEDNRGDGEKSHPDWFLDIQGTSVQDIVLQLVTALLSAKGSDQQLMTQPWAKRTTIAFPTNGPVPITLQEFYIIPTLMVQAYVLLTIYAWLQC